MSVISHKHTDDIIKDADVHFTIDTTTRAISNGNNKKLTIMQYDNKSERYSFDIDRYIDEHDLMDCNRVQIHFINIASNKQKNPGLYLVDDVHVNPDDENKVTFSWLISNTATMYDGTLNFLVSFECIDKECDNVAECEHDDHILYRWSSAVYKNIQITVGMDNNNVVYEMYADELLAWETEMEKKLLTWQNDRDVDLHEWKTNIETEVIPSTVDERYIERDFATSEEVAAIFNISATDDIPVAGVTEINENSTDTQYPTAKAVYTYVSTVVGDIENSLSEV